MKKITIASVMLGIFALLLSVLLPLPGGASDILPQDEPLPESSPLPSPREPMLGWDDSRAYVRMLRGDTIEEISMYEYLVGVVAGEMPAAFEIDALCAQAAAARTYVFYHIVIQPPASHPNADVCGDFTCCAAFLDEAALREQWGDAYDENIRRIETAVRMTDGVYITYDSEPILAVFHSSSHKKTQTADKVWSLSLPYLMSVQTPETQDDVTNFISTVTVSEADFRDTVIASYPDAQLSGDMRGWITDMTFDASGRVDTVTIGGVSITGPQLRALFSLRSAAVTVTIGEDFVFETAGYGHGVGMSQYGANVMAKNGVGWREIIKAYFTGVSFSDEASETPSGTGELV